MSRNSFLTRVRQVASPRKMAKSRLERVQKVNKVSKSLFGPVIKSEFKKWVEKIVQNASKKFFLSQESLKLEGEIFSSEFQAQLKFFSFPFT